MQGDPASILSKHVEKNRRAVVVVIEVVHLLRRVKEEKVIQKQVQLIRALVSDVHAHYL